MKLISLLITFFISISICNSKCIHDNFELPSYSFTHTYTQMPEEASPFRPFRILIDYSNLSSEIKNSSLSSLKEILMPQITNYFQQTIKIRPTESLIHLSDKNEICGSKRKNLYFLEGVDYDLVVFIKESSSIWSVICDLDFETNRPLFAQLAIDFKHLEADTFENSIKKIAHEFVHILGFSKDIFQYFKGFNGYKSAMIDKKHMIALDMKKITRKLKSHFACEKIEGLYLESIGGEKPSSHMDNTLFSEAVFVKSNISFKINELILIALEDSGWYQINYDNSERIISGTNKGCNYFFNRMAKTNTNSYPNSTTNQIDDIPLMIDLSGQPSDDSSSRSRESIRANITKTNTSFYQNNSNMTENMISIDINAFKLDDPYNTNLRAKINTTIDLSKKKEDINTTKNKGFETSQVELPTGIVLDSFNHN